MIVRILLILLFSSQLQASARIDFNELRLREMAKVINARDYEQMLIEMNQLEVLDLACTKETQEQKLPLSCFEVQEKLKKKGLSIKREQETQVTDCNSQFNQLPLEELLKIKEKQRFLPSQCQEQLKSRLQVLVYKRSGKHFE